MKLTDLKIDQLAIINYIHGDANIGHMYKLMRMGVVPGLEITKLSQVATCAEYRIEGMSARIVISKDLSDHIEVDELDETIE